MPPLPLVANVVKVRHHFDIGADNNAVCILHFGYSGPAPDNTACTALAAEFGIVATSDFPGMMSDGVTLTGIDVLDLSSGSPGFGVDPLSVVGTRSGPILPAGAAMLVSYSIGRRYRGGRPRTYWPFFTESDLLNANTWLSASVSSMESTLAGLLSSWETIFSGSTVITGLVNVSYYSGFTSVVNPITGRTRDVPKVRTSAIPADPILGLHVNPHVASQRRRNLIRA